MAREPDIGIAVRARSSSQPVRLFVQNTQRAIQLEAVELAHCPFCKNSTPTAAHAPLSRIDCPICGKQILVPGRLGIFLLHEHIGEGEMGSIYRATDETLEREVAIKLIRIGQADSPESRERLKREACAAGKLNHPRVAQVYSLNFAGDHPYLVMELIAGLDLSEKFNREGPLPERAALRIALDIADGLSALRREGLVHGDVKPANIVLDRDGNAKLVDFGLSGMTRYDSQGHFIGTPYFIAPELLQGIVDTHQSDLYSLGATLYYLLSGKLTHEGETHTDILKARLTQKPMPIDKLVPHLSPATCRLVMHLIEFSPPKRPANSEIVAAEIREALALLENPPKPVAPPRRRRKYRVSSRLRLFQMNWRRTQARRYRYRRVFVRLFVIAVFVGGIAFAVFHPSCEPYRTRLRQAFDQRDKIVEAVSIWMQSAVSRVHLLIERNRTSQPPTRAPDTSPKIAFTAEHGGVWFTMAFGTSPQSGSAIYAGGTLILQGSGTAMWEGPDCCRYVWSRAEGAYHFSASLLVHADQDPLAMTGLMIKGANPAQSDGLFFGILGSGDLVLQLRRANGERLVLKREPPRVSPWRYLGFNRTGDTFATHISEDGREWSPFMTYTLPLASTNSVGFVVSSNRDHTLATAKFTSIQLIKNPPLKQP